MDIKSLTMEIICTSVHFTCECGASLTLNRRRNAQQSGLNCRTCHTPYYISWKDGVLKKGVGETMTDEFERKLMANLSGTQTSYIAQLIDDHILAIASKYKYPVESTAEACRVLCASRAEPASHTLSILNAGNASLCAEFEAIYERLQNENRTNQV